MRALSYQLAVLICVLLMGCRGDGVSQPAASLSEGKLSSNVTGIQLLLKGTVGFPPGLADELAELQALHLQGKTVKEVSLAGSLDLRLALSYYMFGAYSNISLQCLVVQCYPGLNPQSTAAVVQQQASLLGLTVYPVIALNNQEYYVLASAQALSRSALAAIAAQLYTAAPLVVQSVEPSISLQPGASPNDPQVQMMAKRCWAPLKVSAPEAWPNSNKGAGVAVAVFDTGIFLGPGNTMHEDLAGRVHLLSNNYVSNFPAKDELFQNYPDIGSPYLAKDQHYWHGSNYESHGTSVAGIIAANADNLAGGCGIAPLATIVPLKVFYYDPTEREGYSRDYWIAQAAKVLVEANNNAELNGLVRVANWSLHGYEEAHEPGLWEGDVSILEGAADHLTNNSILVVGINGNLPNTSDYPGSYENVFAVGPLDYEDKLPAVYGRWTAWTDIFAPADYNYTPNAAGAASYNPLFNGSSAAAPVVSGCAALAFALGGPSLGPINVRSVLRGTADPCPLVPVDPGEIEALRVDASHYSSLTYQYPADISTNFVAFSDSYTGTADTLLCFPVAMYDNYNNLIGYHPSIRILQNGLWLSEMLPGGHSTLVGLDLFGNRQSEVRLWALLCDIDPGNPQNVDFYETSRPFTGGWSQPAYVGSLSGYTGGAPVFGAKYEKTALGSFAIVNTWYWDQVEGVLQSQFVALGGATAPSHGGLIKDMACAFDDNNVLLLNRNGLGGSNNSQYFKVWRLTSTGGWNLLQPPSHEYQGSATKMVSVGTSGERTGWCEVQWDPAPRLSFQVFEDQDQSPIQSLASPDLPALVERVELIGNSDDKSYIMIWGFNGTNRLVRGVRADWNQGEFAQEVVTGDYQMAGLYFNGMSIMTGGEDTLYMVPPTSQGWQSKILIHVRNLTFN